MEIGPADALFWDKVRRARRMKPEDKLLAGERLFEYTRAIAMAGIRNQHPEATEEQVRQLFRERLILARKLERME